MVDSRRGKRTVAAQKDEALAKRYGKIGISAVAAAAPYQCGSKENTDAMSKSKNAAEKTEFRGTSSRR